MIQGKTRFAMSERFIVMSSWRIFSPSFVSSKSLRTRESDQRPEERTKAHSTVDTARVLEKSKSGTIRIYRNSRESSAVDTSSDAWLVRVSLAPRGPATYYQEWSSVERVLPVWLPVLPRLGQARSNPWSFKNQDLSDRIVVMRVSRIWSLWFLPWGEPPHEVCQLTAGVRGFERLHVTE